MLHCVIELHPSQVHVHGCISQIQNKDKQSAQDVNTAFKSVTLGAPGSNTPQFLSPVLKICPIIRLHFPDVVRNNLKIYNTNRKFSLSWLVITISSALLTPSLCSRWLHNSIGTTGHWVLVWERGMGSKGFRQLRKWEWKMEILVYLVNWHVIVSLIFFMTLTGYS